MDEIQAYFKHDIPGEARSSCAVIQPALWRVAVCLP